MKKIFFTIILSLLALSSPCCAQSDTLPNDLGNQVNTPEGLRKDIDAGD